MAETVSRRAAAGVAGAVAGVDGAAAAPTWVDTDVPAAEVRSPAAGVGRGHGLVSAVDGVEGFGSGGVLPLDTVSDADGAELAKPAPVSSRVMAAAASVAVFSRPGSVSGAFSAAVLPGVTIGSDADAPSGLAGASGGAVPDARGSLGVTTAFGTVTSERLLSCTLAKDGG